VPVASGTQHGKHARAQAQVLDNQEKSEKKLQALLKSDSVDLP
jgi:hypothetical protein